MKTHHIIVAGLIIVILVLTNREVMWFLGIPHGDDLYRVRGLVKSSYSEMEKILDSFASAQNRIEGPEEAKSAIPDVTFELFFGSCEEVWERLSSGRIDLDPFPNDLFSSPFSNYNVAVVDQRILVLGVGPDGDWDADGIAITKAVTDGSIPEKIRYDWAYSPTNGTWSSGDLLKEGNTGSPPTESGNH